MSGPWDKYAERDAGPWAKYATAQPAEDPTATMSGGETFLAGAGKALTDLGRGAKQRLDETAAALESVVPGAQSINRFFGGPSAAQIRDTGQAAVAESKRLDAPLMNTGAGLAGNIAGGVAGGALAAPLGPIGAGAALGYVTPTTKGPEEVLSNMAIGGGAGYVGDKVVKGLSRIVQPQVNPNVRTLMDEGITPTPGQILGGNWARAESKATSIPLVGDAIADSQKRAGAELNRAAFSRALKPIGEKLPANLQGKEAVKFTGDKLGAAYDDLLPKMMARKDQQFATEVESLRAMVADGAIDPNVSATFQRILDNRVLGKFQGQAAMTGETLKSVESHLSKEIARFRRSPDPDVNLMADALDEVQSSLRGLVTRNNPQFANELKAINSGWANFKRVQRAASYLGSDEGVFTPSQLESAVKALDRSKDKARFAEGKALGQDLSGPAKAVMGPKYPDSGTAGRVMNLGGLAAAVYEPTIAAGAAAGYGLYTAPMQRAIATLLTQRPQAAGLLARQIENMTPVGGLLGANLMLANQ